MKNLILLLTFFAVLIGFTAFSSAQVSDIDGNSYSTVTIGKQIWLSQNLNVEKYRNGDPIPQVQDKEEWDALTTGAWCYYENQSENGTVYGKIYNWYAVTDPRGLAPDGWHIPSDEEWTQLMNFLGGQEVAGDKMKSTSGWEEGGNGNNSSGFNAIPGGYRTHDGYFANTGRNAVYWSTTEFNSERGWFRNVIGSIPDVYRHTYDKDFGLYVRCIKD